MLYELDLYCSQIICSAPCLSDCEWCGRIIQINSEHSLKIMSCCYNDIIAQVDFNSILQLSNNDLTHVVFPHEVGPETVIVNGW